MQLSRLSLQQFRTYDSLDLDIGASGIRISGRNASGKTSFLEAIVMLATTRSQRASFDRDVIRWNSGADLAVPPYSRLEGTVDGASGRELVSLTLEQDTAPGAQARKQFFLNGQKSRAQDVVGVLKCVLFTPEDVYLVSGPPVERRRHMDLLISQIDRHYLSTLSKFGRLLSQRNGLLKAFARERRSARDTQSITELSYWDEAFVDAASYIVSARMVATQALTGHMVHRSRALVESGSVRFTYVPRSDLPDLDEAMDPQSRRQIVAAALERDLGSRREEEFRRGMSLIGPHRDDFQFSIDGRSLAQFGSRGQQRLGVVAYKLSEVDLIAGVSGEQPVLLLDDVLSELDTVHRDLLLGAIAREQSQLFVTSTDVASLQHPALANVPLALAGNGTLMTAESG